MSDVRPAFAFIIISFIILLALLGPVAFTVVSVAYFVIVPAPDVLVTRPSSTSSSALGSDVRLHPAHVRPSVNTNINSTNAPVIQLRATLSGLHRLLVVVWNGVTAFLGMTGLVNMIVFAISVPSEIWRVSTHTRAAQPRLPPANLNDEHNGRDARSYDASGTATCRIMSRSATHRSDRLVLRRALLASRRNNARDIQPRASASPASTQTPTLTTSFSSAIFDPRPPPTTLLAPLHAVEEHECHEHKVTTPTTPSSAVSPSVTAVAVDKHAADVGDEAAAPDANACSFYAREIPATDSISVVSAVVGADSGDRRRGSNSVATASVSNFSIRLDSSTSADTRADPDAIVSRQAPASEDGTPPDIPVSTISTPTTSTSTSSGGADDAPSAVVPFTSPRFTSDIISIAVNVAISSYCECNVAATPFLVMSPPSTPSPTIGKDPNSDSNACATEPTHLSEVQKVGDDVKIRVLLNGNNSGTFLDVDCANGPLPGSASALFTTIVDLFTGNARQRASAARVAGTRSARLAKARLGPLLRLQTNRRTKLRSTRCTRAPSAQMVAPMELDEIVKVDEKMYLDEKIDDSMEMDGEEPLNPAFSYQNSNSGTPMEVDPPATAHPSIALATSQLADDVAAFLALHVWPESAPPELNSSAVEQDPLVYTPSLPVSEMEVDSFSPSMQQVQGPPSTPPRRSTKPVSLPPRRRFLNAKPTVHAFPPPLPAPYSSASRMVKNVFRTSPLVRGAPERRVLGDVNGRAFCPKGNRNWGRK